jgi:hypothetical protein
MATYIRRRFRPYQVFFVVVLSDVLLAKMCSIEMHLLTGLPDGIVSNKKIIWVNFGGTLNGRFCHLYFGHLVYFTVFRYILRLFGIFFTFWYVVPRKILKPCLLHC